MEHVRLYFTALIYMIIIIFMVTITIIITNNIIITINSITIMKMSNLLETFLVKLGKSPMPWQKRASASAT